MSTGTRTFDYGGRIVTTSTPVKALKTVKKTLLIDSADRDTTKYYTNGDFVVYLPRVYENVVSMRLAGAEFPPLTSGPGTISSMTISGTTTTVTVASTSGLAVGNLVNIYTGVGGLSSFNKSYAIATIPNSTTFTITTTSASLATGSLTLTNGGGTAPGVFTYTGNITLVNGQIITTNATNGGTIAAGALYVVQASGNTFQLSTTLGGSGATTNATTISGTFTIGPIFLGTSPSASITGARTHSFVYGQTNLSSTVFTNDAVVPTGTYYFLVDIEGMNKVDELAVGGNKSTFVDSYFAKIPAIANANSGGTTFGQYFIEYNDHNSQENIARYSPAIGKLDRLHIRTRLHNQKDSNIGVLYWTSDGNYAGATSNTGANYNLTLEIEYLDNVFDDFSALETHLTSRT